VPVINENDSVATEEIRFGDNDRLAARVAQAAGAQGVVLLSDVDGLYDRDPKDPEAQLVPEVTKVDGRIRIMVSGHSSSGMGSGGMASKLDAADIATRAGIGLAIASGLPNHPLKALDAGAPSTWFAPREGGNARKSWIGGRLSVKGRITVDVGAAKALRGAASLLPAGATSVSGEFRRGDVVDIITAEGEALARGLSEYDAADAALICGKKSSQLEGILGAVPRQVLVHRDQMVML
jgi:glutamate 5-kinase